MKKTVISQTSWHYRWLRHLKLVGKERYLFHGYHYDDMGDYVGSYSIVLSGPKSICSYFWLLGSVTWIPLVLATTFVFEMVTHPMWFVWGVFGGLVGVATLAVIFGIAASIVFVTGYLHDSIKAYFRSRSQQLPDPNAPTSARQIAWQFIKAKKNKVCPLIELVD